MATRGAADIRSRLGALTPDRRRLLARMLGGRRGPETGETAGASRLTAFVVADPEGADEAALREHLRGALPEYMLPQRFVHVRAIARTSNGKPDRKRLAAAVEALAEDTPLAPEHPGDEAADDLEAAVASIWAELLGVHAPRGDDDFFELGGHSLLGASLCLRIERELGIAVPLSVLFEATRLGDFVQRIRGARNAEAARFLTRLKAGGSMAPLFCVHAPARSLVQHLHPQRPVYNFIHNLDPADPTDASVEAVAEKYLVELHRVAPAGPYRLCGFSVGGMIAQEMAQRLVDSGHDVELLALADPPPLVQRGFFHYRVRNLLSRFNRRSGLLPRLRFLVTEPLAMLGRRVSALRLSRAHRASEAGGEAPTYEALAFYNMTHYVRIGAAYRMRRYERESVLFLPHLEAGLRDWVCRQWRLALPGLRAVYEIRDAATHAEMFEPPHVEQLSALLARHVEGDAQPRERASAVIPVHSASSAPDSPMATSEA